MRRFLILLTLLLLGIAFPVFGQTTVNLSVIDTPDNQTWNNGTWAVKLQPPPGNLSQTNTFTLLSGGGSLAAQNGTLSGTGTASMSLPANANIGPAGTVWQFTVCPQASAGCFQQSVTVSTSSPQTLALNPPSIRINLATATPPISAYATGEISGAVIGSQFYLLGTGIQVCSVISGNTCTTWVASGGGINSNSPVPIASAQGPRYNVQNYGAKGDAKKAFRAVITNGSSTITDTLDFNPWVAADVGKKIFCIDVGSGQTGQNPLSVAIATISAVNSATSISIAPATGNGFAQSGTPCVWYTQDDTAAFTAAGVAAGTTIATANFKGFSEYTYPGMVYCPEGGYVVSSNVLDQQGGNPYTLGVSFVGAGRAACRIYPIPGVTAAHSAWFMSLVQTGGQTIGGFSVDCGFGAHALGVAMFNFNNMQHARLYDIEEDSCGDTGAAAGIFAFNGASDIELDLITANGTSLGSSQAMFLFSGVSGVIHARNIDTTNPGNFPLQVSNSGGQATGNPSGCFRSATSTQIIFEESVFDEGGSAGAVQVTSNSCVNFKGVGMFAGATTVLTVDGTSGVYLDSSNLTSFGGGCSGGSRQAITESSGSYVYATGTTIAGCGSNGAGLSAAVSGPAGATFVSAGGNNILNCQGVLPCPLVTAANFATLGFNGGIVPKSSETHTPNTCYAVTGNLLATAQNLCTFLNDQNYQLLNMTAQSGGTTPANSACATPPVITLSDGTRSATLTMTSGKTQWSSAVDAVTNINQVFAGATTLTVSIGANTCATPPVNVAVSYVVQSVLNP